MPPTEDRLKNPKDLAAAFHQLPRAAQDAIAKRLDVDEGLSDDERQRTFEILRRLDLGGRLDDLRAEMPA